MTPGLIVRLEEPGDIAGVRDTNDQAFGTPLEGRIVDALRGATDCVSFVAALDGLVVGHILFSPVTLEPSANVRLTGLAPMAVRPEHQRRGVGGQLIRAGLDECRRRGYEGVVVLGHPEYYPRFGFVPAHTRGLQCEFPSPPEAFMAIELKAGGLSGMSGLVRFRPEFSAAE
jgi:putative acetyltransferase